MHVDGRPAAAKLNSPLVLSFYPLVQGKRQHSYGLGTYSGSLAMFTAIIRAASRMSNLAA
jgi:hypothetical protein